MRATPQPTTAPSSLDASGSPRRSWARLVLAFAILTGLVGAVGVVLIVLSTRHRGVTPPVSAADAATSAHAATQSSAEPAPAPPPPPAASSDPVIGAVPPSTGTAGRASTPGDTSSRTPAARRRAAELGVDPSRVRGSGPAGRVTREDVEAVAAERASLLGNKHGQADAQRRRKAFACSQVIARDEGTVKMRRVPNRHRRQREYERPKHSQRISTADRRP
jgi:pyruvate/2-oxoglutarate dehydrogenase complex dihydrolipoamide acyltransferase (E2) component